jgi:urease accessory protein
MLSRFLRLSCHAALLFAVGVSLAHAHHPMDYALPATALEGFLSGIGHPVIGIDHLLFIAGAGVLAAFFDRGWFLPLLFVVASVFSAGVRYFGADLGLGELPVAGTLVVLGAMMLAPQLPREGVIALLFLAAGTLHGHALGEAVVGAERTPLVAYLFGLTVIQCVIALVAWRAAAWLAVRHPRVPLRQLTGAVAGIAGLVFSGMVLMG